VAEASADYRGVLRALKPLAEQDIRDPVNEPEFWPWADVYANALVMEGELDRAEHVIRQHEELARERDSVVALARLAVPHGRLLAARGRIDEAREMFERGLDRIDGLPWEFDRARLWFAYGQSLRRAGKRREADAALLSARQLFARLSATRYVERCDREIAAAGIGTQRGVPDDVELTAQESVVAGLVVQGKSNREVAAEIFLSAKTVQYHLTRIYAKLGIRSRGELTARLGASATGNAVDADD
jgi:ATP/maltotriose-dependent transcriptional regulator MalT